MRAIRVRAFGEPSVMQVEEMEVPRPGPNEVLVRLRAAGVNPVEAYVRRGQYARLPELPYTPGSDGAGEVAAVGEGVEGLREGDRVFLTGAPTYAEYCLCDAQGVFPLPPSVTYAQGAAIGIPYGTALYALRRAGAQAGDRLLVRGGSGAVGTAALQLGRALGMRCVGTAGSPQGLRLVERQGAERATSHDDGEGALAATGGRGFDVIVDVAAHHGLAQDLALLAPGGRVAVVGSRGPVEIQPRALMSSGGSVHGILFFLIGEEELRRIFLTIGAGLRDGTLRPAIGDAFSLERAPEAHERVLRPAAQGKVVLTID